MTFGGKAKGRKYDFIAALRHPRSPPGSKFWQAVEDATAWLGRPDDKMFRVAAYLKDVFCAHCVTRFKKKQPFVRFCSKECRFKSIVSSIKPNDGGCLLWPLAIMQATGYGQFTFRDSKTRTVTAHRMSYTVFNGPIADGLLVLHKCDKRACVNPSHLFLGTQQDNIRDMLAKGRHPDMVKNLGHYAIRKAC